MIVELVVRPTRRPAHSPYPSVCTRDRIQRDMESQASASLVSIVDERSRGTALCAAAYLVKPVSRDDLLAALAAVAIPIPRAGAPSVHEVP